MRRLFIGWCAAACLATAITPLSARQENYQPPALDAIRDHPLVVARQSLLQARSQVLKQQYTDSIPPLAAAAEALAYFEQQQPGAAGRDAGYTRQEIRNYCNAVETDHSDAVSRINTWLSRVQQWSSGR